MTHDPLCPQVKHAFEHRASDCASNPECHPPSCQCELIAKAKKNQHWKSFDFGFEEGWEACKRTSATDNTTPSTLPTPKATLPVPKSTFSISRSTGLTVSSLLKGGKP
jgi:hypothetical protein